MEPLLYSLESTLSLVLRMGSIMFISLFGIELFMQMGLMKYLKPIGTPVARLANLPSESALSFLAAIGSMIAAHTMAAQFRADHKMSDQELLLTGVLNTVPFHFKETLTFQLPVVLPLLGFQLCMIYIAVFWLTGILKIGFVILWGRIRLKPRTESENAFDNLECSPMDRNCLPRSFKQLIKDTWLSRKKMYLRMVSLLAGVTFFIQLLMNSGLLGWLEALIAPLTSIFDLPAAVIGPVSTYMFSPTVGITYMSNLMNQDAVTSYQAIVSLLIGGLLMIPVTRVRRTLPRYTAIYGLKSGFAICGLTTGFSILARIVILFWVLIFF
ncbi:hypothetical protein [Desulfospira joergensenii]|uniref:hypothetical protein n=1 Tax=Desulfospira joergensenii TaxID=53329 RepID=UPI0003B3124C|nr:hypothetical protein [Desulfospira joergensenii]